MLSTKDWKEWRTVFSVRSNRLVTPWRIRLLIWRKTVRSSSTSWVSLLVPMVLPSFRTLLWSTAKSRKRLQFTTIMSNISTLSVKSSTRMSRSLRCLLLRLRSSTRLRESNSPIRCHNPGYCDRCSGFRYY